MTVRAEASEHLSAPLRVALATARYPPFSGGVELHVHEVARRLAVRGTTVEVLTTDVTGALPAHEFREGVEVRRFGAWPRGRDYYFSPGLHAAIGRGDWDLLHVHSFQTLVAPLAMLAARRRGLPYVLTFHRGGHSSRLRSAAAPLQLTLLRPLLRRAGALIVLTEDELAVYTRLLGLPRERFAVVSNGSDLPRDSAVAEVVRDPDLIASPGRLERYKGHDRVVSALPYILERRPGIRLWIAGGGPQEAELRALAERLGVADRVEIRAVPVMERLRLAHELARVELVISMSAFESQGIAVLEAVGMGCRAIVADTPGLRVLAEQGLARAIPHASSPREIADAVIEGLERPPATATPRLPTWDDCTDALVEIYRAVVGGRDGH